MPVNNEQIIMLLLPTYSHSFCRSDTHLSARDKYRNRESSAKSTKSLQIISSEHLEITSLEEYPGSRGLSQEQIKAVQDKLPDMELPDGIPNPIHCYTQRLHYLFT